MRCVDCDSPLVSDLVELTGPYRGREVRVRMNGLRCKACGFVTVRGRDMPQFRKLVQETYCAEEQVLQGAELQQARKEMKRAPTQELFANYLGIGVASLKRLEAGAVPERLMGEHVRMRLYPELMQVVLQDRLWSLNSMKGALAELPYASAQCTVAWKSLADCYTYDLITLNYDAILQEVLPSCAEKLRGLAQEMANEAPRPDAPVAATNTQLALAS
jgi:hypothetical protein